MQEQEVLLKNPKLHGVEESALEKCLFLWCRERRERNEPISGPIIKEKAKLLNEKLGGSSSFQASEGWLSGFKKRHGLRALKMKGEKLSNNPEAADNFVKWINLYVQEEGYDWENVYNADETGLAWKALPTNSIVMRSEKEAAGFKVPKDRLTLMVCTNATGSHKIPLLVIGKSKKPRYFKNISHIPVEYVGQKSAWMDRVVFREWYMKVFLPAIKQRQKGSEKTLLILDNAPSHPNVDELNSIDSYCRIKFLPPNVTALVQPMDQGVIEALKKAYAQRFLRNLLISSEGGSNRTDFLKKWTVLECCRALFCSWNSISELSIKHAWKKINTPPTSVTTMTPRTETSTQELAQLANQLLNDDLTVQDVSNWIADDRSCPTHRVLSDEDILQNFENIQNLYETEEETRNDDTDKLNDSSDDSDEDEIPSQKDAIECCKKLYCWLAAQPNCKKEIFTSLDVIDDFVRFSIQSQKDTL